MANNENISRSDVVPETGLEAERTLELITELKNANYAYNVAVEQNINVPNSRRRAENLLWTYREELISLIENTGNIIEAYEKKVADMNNMLDTLATLPEKPKKKAAAEAE